MSKADARLSQLYAEQAAGATRLAYLLTGDVHTAQDVVQEAFARLGSRILTLRDPDRAAGYLYRTVANLARGHGRRVSRDRALTQRLPAPGAEQLPDLELRDEVWQGLLSLSQRHRMALFLRYYLDMSEADAAQLLDCSPAAMKSLTHRASEALRKHLGGEPS